MQRNRNTLKQWFETGDFPTQEQFADLIDSMFNHIDDDVQINDIQGLIDVLNEKASTADLQNIITNSSSKQEIIMNADGPYNLLAGLLLNKVIVIPSQNLPAFKIGFTVGGDEIMQAVDLAANVPTPITVDVYADVITAIHFSGVANNTQLILYKQ
jgi:hypothetical protein